MYTSVKDVLNVCVSVRIENMFVVIEEIYRY